MFWRTSRLSGRRRPLEGPLPIRVLAIVGLWLGTTAAQAACPPPGLDLAGLRALKADGFEVADADRPGLALALPDCLADPDPELRDGIAYEALSAWLRGGKLPPPLRRSLRDRLQASLEAPDAGGFAAPFAALTLAEIARTDRIGPWMTPAERADMVARAAAWLASVSDHRGYVDGQGWRHGVAHGADWVMQLALNRRVDRVQLQRLLDAVASQVAPADGHAYIHGEPARLARPVLLIARRGLVDAEAWRAWFGNLPGRVGDPALAYADEGWLARRHDLAAFLSEIYLQADRSDDERVRALKPLAHAALDALP